ncbi:hypothetical protein PNEG_03513 [Pneumocystis murina B123]|uniref:DUF2415 domain-containing protein n=1 Tax=Pneumocystis murina (strain B123) TaxID=1069680 RepID=M7NHM7_PNEMU|nr:hypothetical protein PNEG_03513 [Pneumocystis murina B123]EMR08073.1 hypothetical protein PNEG_03513 [Pneumocystis murina B123]
MIYLSNINILSYLYNSFLDEKKRRYFKISEDHVVGVSYPYSLGNIYKNKKKSIESKKQRTFAQTAKKIRTCFFQRNLNRELGKLHGGLFEHSLMYSYDMLWIERLFLFDRKELSLQGGSSITCLNFSPDMNNILFGTSDGLLGVVKVASITKHHEFLQLNISQSTSGLTSLNVSSNGIFICTFMGNEKKPGHFQIGTIRKNTEENLSDYGINVTVIPQGKNTLWASAIAPSGEIAAIGGSKMAMVIKGIDGANYTSYSYNLKSDVFAIKFLNTNTFLAGYRNGWIDLLDTRCLGSTKSCFTNSLIKHKSSISNFDLTSDYHLVVAGLENSLNMYDIRMIHSEKDMFSRPVLFFNGYTNECSFGLGFDISRNRRIVAASGQDQIYFWSTLDGRLLRRIMVKSNRACRAFKFYETSTNSFEELCLADDSYLEWWCSN